MSAQKLVYRPWYIVFIAIIFLSSVTPVFAATEPSTVGKDLGPTNFGYKENAQTTLEGGILHTILCWLPGFSLYGPCVGYKYEDGKAKPLVYDKLPNGGALGMLGTTTMALYTPPTSATLYLANLGESIGIAPKPAYAQVAGSGAGIIQPVLALWQAVRNIAYLAFILVFLTVGFMIMFRSKINPQTVISVQAALPSLVIGLILITFSYFIAALVVDLAFVGVSLSGQVFKTSELINSLGDPVALSQNSNIFQMFLHAGVNNIGPIFNSTREQFISTGNSLPVLPQGSISFPAIIGGLVAGLMFAPAWAIAGPAALVGIGVGAAGQFLIPGIVLVVVLIALFVQLFKLVFNLITTYIQLLVFTMAGPLFILYGSIPGRGGAISFWFRGLLANSLIFPTIFAVFLFAGSLIGNDTQITSNLPLLGGLNGNFVKLLLAFGLILGTPAIPGIIRGLFKVELAPQLMKEAFSGAQSGVGAIGAGYQRATVVPKALRQAREKAELTSNETRFAGGSAGFWERLASRFPGT